MKIYQYILPLILIGAFYTGHAIAKEKATEAMPEAPLTKEEQKNMPEAPFTKAEKKQGKAIVKEMLKAKGHTDKEIKDALKNPDSPLKALGCDACKKLESIIGDPDTTCGGNSWGTMCTAYMAGSLISYIQKNKDTACTAIQSNKSTICGWSSSTLNSALSGACGGFSCS